MKSTFKIDTGISINIEAIRRSRFVWIEMFFEPSLGIEPRAFFIPADLAGVVAQAIELAGQAALEQECATSLRAPA